MKITCWQFFELTMKYKKGKNQLTIKEVFCCVCKKEEKGRE